MKITPIITSDFLMTSGEEQDNNIKWVNDLIKRPVCTAINLTPECFSTKSHNTRIFSRDIFFKKSNIICNEEDKQFYFNEHDINVESIDYLKKSLPDNTLFISYELSNQTKFILNKAGFIYIDIWLHPVRYMDDVLFGIRSNSEKINNKIKKHNIPTETYCLYSDRLKVQNYRGHRRSKARVKNNSALFIGQTLNDKAIFYNNKMLTLLDFKKEFEDATRKYSHVYYSRHPFVKEGDEDVISYLKRFKNVSINDDPAYHLLASSEIEYVFSISSSVVHEAKYFGKETKFLFRPVIKIGDVISDESEEIYYSVMHSLYYGYFWSDILCDITTTIPLPKIEYFSGKDKTRDALSFYWGYRNIDKTESIKQTLSTLWFRNNNSTTEKNKMKKKQTQLDIFELIDNHRVISFDIFDTLITRSTYSPREIFNFVETKFNSENTIKISDFRQFRILAEDEALKDIIANGGQECTIDEIYTKLQDLLPLQPEAISQLKDIELKTELKYSRRRDRGIELLDYAKQKNKKIILTSDMYLNSSQIKKILQKNNIIGYDELYVSSEIGLKKKTGDLFKYILKEEGLREEEILHIGDNIDGDKKVPESIGLASYRVPRAIDIAKFSHPHLRNWIDTISSNKTDLFDIIITLITNKFYDREIKKESSLYDADKYRFGYHAFGPLVIGFTIWIRNEALKKGINKLFFLSRDTKVIYDCYKILFPNEKIETKYIYASRRSVKIPLLKDKHDLYSPIYKTIYSTTISKWLENNYGITKNSYPESLLLNLGLSGYDQPIGAKFNKKILSDIINELQDMILENARKERDDIKDYLNSVGMNTDKNVAVVDIGYAATMQAAYTELLDKNNIYGLYFATFNTALKNIKDINLISGYSLTLGSPSTPNIGICTHRFFYESIFCDADNSFVKVEKNESGYLFHKTDFNDDVRQKVVNEIHTGVLSLATDIMELAQPQVLNTYIDPRLSSLLLDSFLAQPDEQDARMFSGVLFEDSSVPNAIRYLYAPDEFKNDKAIISNVIWKEPVKLFFSKQSVSDSKEKMVNPPKKISLSSQHYQGMSNTTKKSPLIALESKIIGFGLNEKKIKKYNKDRELFFADSKNKVIAIYYKSIGKRLSK